MATQEVWTEPEPSDGATVGRQALRRMVNRRLRDARAASATETIDIFCECGRRLCATRVPVAALLYDEVLAAAAHYVVSAPHQDGDQGLVSSHEGFVVTERGASREHREARAKRRRPL